ncbi:MAG: penicillin-binding transpeptidase domain-containing protein [Candidatus Babeliales bacterium]
MIHQYTNFINKKIKIIQFILFIIVIFISIRLFYLQVNLTHYLFDRSQQNFLRKEKVESLRGNIRDCKGTLLATNRPVHNLYWQGTGKTMLTDEHYAMLHQLGKIVDNNFTTDIVDKKIMNTEKRKQQFPLFFDLSFDQLSKIIEQFPDNPNLYIDTHVKRYYPYQSLASHILGYLGNLKINQQGKMGLEKLCEDMLHGTHGTQLKTINSFGKNIAKITLQKAFAGQDIDTTIDLQLQNICETVFPDIHVGTLILMDPADGSILGLLSRPNFDPNIFLETITIDQWQTLQKQQPFLNRAFDACYPPGSLFKLITMSAALEHNIISEDETLLCNGFTSFARRKYWCSRRYGHGELTIAQALAQSCNIPFYEIGKKINIDILADYAYTFGLGKKTNLLFNEKKGIVPNKKWKEETKGEQWWPGETLSVAIGQSFLLVTPIQIACMIASIFTGYLISPRILSTEPLRKQPLNLEATTFAFLKKSMMSVVTRGTGKRINKVKDILIYAKTSTAQISTFQKSKLNDAYLEHGWFVAHFQYKKEQPLVIVILVENAGTAQVSTRIAENFLIEYKKLIDNIND